MKLRWTTRTSLFARMSLLFGLLVTVPLIISGVVLRAMGRQVEQRSASPVKDKLQEALRRLWEGAAERRASAIQDFDGIVLNQVVSKMQVPVRNVFVITAQPQAPRILERFILKSARPP